MPIQNFINSAHTARRNKFLNKNDEHPVKFPPYEPETPFMSLEDFNKQNSLTNKQNNISISNQLEAGLPQTSTTEIVPPAPDNSPESCPPKTSVTSNGFAPLATQLQTAAEQQPNADEHVRIEKNADINS